MNLKQRIVLAVALILAAGAGLYPPWKPQPYSLPRFHALWRGSSAVDLGTLFTEWAVILFVALAVILLLADRKKP